MTTPPQPPPTEGEEGSSLIILWSADAIQEVNYCETKTLGSMISEAFSEVYQAKADMKRLRRKTSSALICCFAPLVMDYDNMCS